VPKLGEAQMRDNPKGGELDPAVNPATCRWFIVVVQSPLLYQVVCRNGEANFPRGPTIRLPSNRLLLKSSQ